ncbi:mechanosensitive ion channel family protein [Rapidithrix thailandica]|uniref:Mechanosensing system component YbdG n=1 Tax=Rapidithrix thailandica TaxID=413964 RepID=A0AAW9S2H6_9BACT
MKEQRLNMLDSWLEQILSDYAIPEDWIIYIILFINLALIGFLGVLGYYFIKESVVRFFSKYYQRTESKIVQVLLKDEIVRAIARLFPIFLFVSSEPYLLRAFKNAQPIVLKLSYLVLLYFISSSIIRFLDFLREILTISARTKDKPIDSYIQLSKIIVYAFTTILFLSILVNKDPLLILGALGATSAVMLLVFKDTILGLVASVQISALDMVKVGDWIQMPKYGADGDVIKITLNTVKVLNFDKTISTIPTYALISESFKNWRNVYEVGGRRIKRSLLINMNSVKYCERELLENLRSYRLIQKTVDNLLTKLEEEESSNTIEELKKNQADEQNFTNLGLFRQYAENYLKHSPRIRQDMFLMVRPLEPTPRGIPLEVYGFTNDTYWPNYERIQADIFDHLIAVTQDFDLEVYQEPTGLDFQNLSKMGFNGEKS